MKPKTKQVPDLQPEPPEDAKMTGRKGGIKKIGKDMSDIRPSGPSKKK